MPAPSRDRMSWSVNSRRLPRNEATSALRGRGRSAVGEHDGEATGGPPGLEVHQAEVQVRLDGDREGGPGAGVVDDEDALVAADHRLLEAAESDLVERPLRQADD